jgi:hypothetical protein
VAWGFKVEFGALAVGTAVQLQPAGDGSITPPLIKWLSSNYSPPQVSKFDDLHDAALSVVAESYRLWLQ